jgi:hypothetical protein
MSTSGAWGSLWSRQGQPTAQSRSLRPPRRTRRHQPGARRAPGPSTPPAWTVWLHDPTPVRRPHHRVLRHELGEQHRVHRLLPRLTSRLGRSREDDSGTSESPLATPAEGLSAVVDLLMVAKGCLRLHRRACTATGQTARRRSRQPRLAKSRGSLRNVPTYLTVTSWSAKPIFMWSPRRLATKALSSSSRKNNLSNSVRVGDPPCSSRNEPLSHRSGINGHRALSMVGHRFIWGLAPAATGEDGLLDARHRPGSEPIVTFSSVAARGRGRPPPLA